MNAKTILIGGLAAAGLIAAGLVMGDGGEERTEEPAKGLLFPDFDPNAAAAIEVAFDGGEYRIDRDGDAWGLVAKDGYPVDIGQVRELLLAVDGAKIVDAKTKDPALHGRLGLDAQPNEGDVHWRRVVIRGAGGATEAAMILGKRPEGRDDEAYARRDGEDQTWLIELYGMNLPADAEAWIPKDIIKVPRERIRAARVTHADGEVVTVSKSEPSDAHYVFHELGERKLRYESAPDGLGSSLEYLKLEDVARDGDVELGDAEATRVSLWTWDGVRLDVTITPKDDVHWATFVAWADPDGVPTVADAASDGEAVAEAEVTPETRQAEVDEWNARVQGWIFQLPAYNVTALSKRSADLVEKPKPAEGPPSLLTPNEAEDDGAVGDEFGTGPAPTDGGATPSADDEAGDPGVDDVDDDAGDGGAGDGDALDDAADGGDATADDHADEESADEESAGEDGVR